MATATMCLLNPVLPQHHKQLRLGRTVQSPLSIPMRVQQNKPKNKHRSSSTPVQLFVLP